MKRVCLVLLFAASLTWMLEMAVHTQSLTPQQTLDQYVSDLQKNPDDYALREKIIKLVQTMKPAPRIPEEAERHMARAGAALETAKTETDLQDAVAELEQALLVTPWLPAAYYNLGVTQDKAGMYAKAIQNLTLYLVAAPDAPDAKTVRNLIYEIEYRQEKAAKESSPQVVAQKKEDQYQAWLASLDGARYVRDFSNNQISYFLGFEIHGNQVMQGGIVSWCSPAVMQTNWQCNEVGRPWHTRTGPYEIRNGQVSWDLWAGHTCTGTINKDGITFTVHCPPAANNPETTEVYRRVRQ